MRNCTATLAACAALLGAGVVISSGADAKGPPGPQFSIEVQASCGDPVALDPLTLMSFGEYNVAVLLDDVSDDNGPVGAYIGYLEVACTAAVKEGRGKPNDVEFVTINVPDSGFGLIEVSCPVGQLPAGATEWKATATASGADVKRSKSDTCEEVPVIEEMAAFIVEEPVVVEETVPEVIVTQ